MCGLPGPTSTKVAHQSQDRRAQNARPVSLAPGEDPQKVSFKRPDTNKAKGWGYNAFSVPTPVVVPTTDTDAKKPETYEQQEEQRRKRLEKDEHGNYPFSMPDAKEGRLAYSCSEDASCQINNHHFSCQWKYHDVF